MAYYCPRTPDKCGTFPTIAAMEEHVVLHEDYDYDEDRVAEEPTAESEE